MTAHSTGSSAYGTSVAIIGAGFAGICMGIRLRQAGIDSFSIYEKTDRVGGVWRDNSYPGAACDVPSAVYSFSFEPRYDWPDVYSRQAAILEYLEHCVDKYGLGPHIRFNTEIARIRFKRSAGAWELTATDGESLTAHAVITGVGQLNRPCLPDIPGLDEFLGPKFHSASWNHELDFGGRSVAVIGNGASAIQFIPVLAEQAEQLLVFQRTPNWVIPHLPKNRAYRRWEKWALRYVPFYARIHRALIYALYEMRLPAFTKGSLLGRFLEWRSRRHLRAQVADPRLREALTPDYPIGCKRILLSTDIYPALTRPNVRLVTDPIARVSATGIVTREGGLHDVDAIILATGFDVQNYLAPMIIEGLDGHRIPDDWRDGAEAYLGVAVSGFPNLFLMYGPNTSLGHHSIVAMIEPQAHYILQCIEALKRAQPGAIDVRPEVQAGYNEWLQQRLGTRVWDAGCRSWYKTESGRITSLWAGSTIEYGRRMRRFAPGDYRRVEVQS